MGVKYQVERRPIGPTGKVYRGTQPGDYVSVLSNPTDQALGGPEGLVTSIKQLGSGSGAAPKYVPAGFTIPPLVKASSTQEFSHVVEVSGEPWLTHSTHYSVESALESAAPLAGAIGQDNVRIVKVISHTTLFKIQ